MFKFALGVCVGAAISTAIAQVPVSVSGNGVLSGYIVQDENGVEICKNPNVWVQFRGPESYIVCPTPE